MKKSIVSDCVVWENMNVGREKNRFGLLRMSSLNVSWQELVWKNSADFYCYAAIEGILALNNRKCNLHVVFPLIA